LLVCRRLFYKTYRLQYFKIYIVISTAYRLRPGYAASLELI
jgi:hypothetical protein